MPDQKVIVITGASSGFGNLAAREFGRAGYTVYAGMRATADRNANAVAELAELSVAEAIDGTRPPESRRPRPPDDSPRPIRPPTFSS